MNQHISIPGIARDGVVWQRHSETGELVIATATEYHHRAVWVQPFEDDNGRWARLLANIWLMQHDQLNPSSLKNLKEILSKNRLQIIALRGPSMAKVQCYEPHLSLMGLRGFRVCASTWLKSHGK